MTGPIRRLLFFSFSVRPNLVAHFKHAKRSDSPSPRLFLGFAQIGLRVSRRGAIKSLAYLMVAGIGHLTGAGRTLNGSSRVV